MTAVDVAGWAALAAPHIATVEQRCTDDDGGIDLAHLLGEYALFEQSQGRYESAYRLKQRALPITEAALDPTALPGLPRQQAP